MKKNKIYLISIIITIMFGLTIYYFDVKQNQNQFSQIIINNHTFNVKLAQTSKEKKIGLSKHEQLGENDAMLFVFKQYKKPSFWMKDMKFPIDIIWIRDKQVVDIDANLMPEFKTPFSYYSPTKDVNYVLEINAGLAKKYHISKGMPVQLTK